MKSEARRQTRKGRPRGFDSWASRTRWPKDATAVSARKAASWQPPASIPQIQLERRRRRAPVEGDARELVALGDVVEELGEEAVEGHAFVDGGFEARGVDEIGVFEAGEGGHEGVEARVVAGAEQRVAHGAEVRQELAHVLKVIERGPAIFVG